MRQRCFFLSDASSFKGHIFWWPSLAQSSLGEFSTTTLPNHLKLQPKQQLANVNSGYYLIVTVFLVVWKSIIVIIDDWSYSGVFFLSRICSLNSDVLRLRWDSRSLVMDPGPGSQSSPSEYWLHKNQLTSGEINSQLFITSQLFSSPLCQREVFFICDQATISKASPSQSCRSQ